MPRLPAHPGLRHRMHSGFGRFLRFLPHLSTAPFRQTKPHPSSIPALSSPACAQIVDDPASDPESSEQAQQIAAAVGEVPWRRRQLEYRRMLLAAAKEKSGVVLQVTVQTTLVRWAGTCAAS